MHSLCVKKFLSDRLSNFETHRFVPIITTEVSTYTTRLLVVCTWSVQKVSPIWLSIFDFRFLVTLCWYSYLSLMPTSSAILNVQLIFESYFSWTCFGSPSIFAYSKKWIKDSASNFQGGTVNNK